MSRMRGKWILIAGVVTVAVAGTIVWTEQGERTKFPFAGQLMAAGMVANGHGGCEGTPVNGSGDVVPGAPVKVFDVSGKLLATGKLSTGKPGPSTDSGNLGVCYFGFRIPNVPLGQETYSLLLPDQDQVMVPAKTAESETTLIVYNPTLSGRKNRLEGA